MKTKTLMLTGLAFLLAFSTSCRQTREEETSSPSIPVRTAAVERQEIARPVPLYGRLAAKKELRLSFKVPGIIEHILVKEGQSVRKDQTLARLNLAEVESQVKQARSAFEKASRDLERVTNLFKEKAVTLEQVQNVQTAYDIANSQLRAAEFNLRFSEIKAPSSGRVLKRLAEEHEMVAAGMPVILFASLDEDWIVRSAVSDSDLVRLRLDDPAKVSFDAYPGLIFQGRVTETAEFADPLTGTYEVEVRLEPARVRLVSGLVARVDIFPSDKKAYAVIPADALVEARGQRALVYTVDSATSTARAVEVVVGFLFEDKAAVAEGLENIGRVVTDGAPYLTSGALVQDVTGRSPDPAAQADSGKKK